MHGEAQISSADPICTVAIPVYNQRAFISRSVKSALDQDGIKVRVIVVDNCSDDGTWEYLQALKCVNLAVYRNGANLGLFGNFNRCLELAQTPYIRFLSGDDVLAPRCLRGEIRAMQENADVAMLTTRGRFVTPDGKDLGFFANDFPAGVYSGSAFATLWFWYYARCRRNPLNYPSGMLFRQAAIQDIRFEEAWRTTGDIDFCFKVLQNGNLAILDSLGCEVTLHPHQAHVVPNLDGTAIEEHLLLMERYIARREREALRKYIAASCVALSLRRLMQKKNWASARLHWHLARRLATLPEALTHLGALIGYRGMQWMLGQRAPFVPRPDRLVQ